MRERLERATPGFLFAVGLLALLSGTYSGWFRIPPFQDGPFGGAYKVGSTTGLETLPGKLLFWGALAGLAVLIGESMGVVSNLLDHVRVSSLVGVILGLSSTGLALWFAVDHPPLVGGREIAGGGYLLGVGGLVLLWASALHYAN